MVLASGMSGTVYVFEPNQLFDSTFLLESATQFVGLTESTAHLAYAEVHSVGDFNGDGYKVLL